MKVLLAGADGQVARSLCASAPHGCEIRGYARRQLDITDREAVRRVVNNVRPTWIINAAAYTAVDRAENEHDQAFAINRDGVQNLASAGAEFGARLLTLSTDFVFDGHSGVPYAPDSAPNPLNVYGASKLAGEQVAGPTALIVRTAWVHAAAGHNFLKTMLRLLTERSEVRVVADQIGSPTSADDLAGALWKLLGEEASGIHHFTNSGVASWYDLAAAIAEEGRAMGLLDAASTIVPISTTDLPTPAIRPACAVLDKQATFALLGRPAPHWRDGLRRTLRDIRNG